MSENVTRLKPVAQPVEEQTEDTRTAKVFKPEPVTVTLGDTTYNLVYDLNSFCEMEKMYNSVDEVIQMLLGRNVPDTANVTYCGAPAMASDIMVDGEPLEKFIAEVTKTRKAKHSDTLNLLWLGVLHDHASYDDDGNIVKYDVSKAQLGRQVTFTNLREVNAKIMVALLRDLLPAVAKSDEGAAKNPQAPEATQE